MYLCMYLCMYVCLGLNQHVMILYCRSLVLQCIDKYLYSLNPNRSLVGFTRWLVVAS